MKGILIGIILIGGSIGSGVILSYILEPIIKYIFKNKP